MKKIIVFSLLISLVIGLLFGIFLYFNFKIEPTEEIKEDISHQQMVYIHTLEMCESTGRTDIKILDSNNKYSYGCLMFQLDTFYRYGVKYEFFSKDISNKELEKLIYDCDLQEKIAHRILQDGGWSNWYNCWKKLKFTKYPN